MSLVCAQNNMYPPLDESIVPVHHANAHLTSHPYSMTSPQNRSLIVCICSISFCSLTVFAELTIALLNSAAPWNTFGLGTFGIWVDMLLPAIVQIILDADHYL